MQDKAASVVNSTTIDDRCQRRHAPVSGMRRPRGVVQRIPSSQERNSNAASRDAAHTLPSTVRRPRGEAAHSTADDGVRQPSPLLIGAQESGPPSRPDRRSPPRQKAPRQGGAEQPSGLASPALLKPGLRRCCRQSFRHLPISYKRKRMSRSFFPDIKRSLKQDSTGTPTAWDTKTVIKNPASFTEKTTVGPLSLDLNWRFHQE